MSGDSPSTYVLQRTFADVDDLTAEARQWDVDFRQIERGKFDGELLQFATGGVHISEARFCRSLNQKGSPPKGMRTVAVPACPEMRLEWRGKEVDSESLMLFPIGAELSSVSGPDFHVYTCSFPDQLLSVVGEALEVGSFDELSAGVDAIRVGAAAIDNLRRCLSKASDFVRDNPGSISESDMGRLLTQELPRRLVAAIAAGREVCPPAFCQTRQTALTRAEDYIELHVSCDIKVRDICQAAGVSERTLQYLFLERFGIGPKEFLKALRLNKVRRQLRSAESKITKVADVANAWGFWHMGQFAADYRERFEELPSETLLHP
ncbi:transcriptional regulator EutR [Symmachiella macrocystis]|uniref:Transcriptional regulator EutR n=2 Tax=Symmachiella macrocystis TaxID=2527985 RepID=A0A5C6BR41_9PLAN|nr:transcriptional regulator EutR [Symmachiella macrocystis]